MNTIKRDNKNNTPPIKIIQFGEGNFLRAFVDYAFQQLNEKTNFNGGIAVVQPIEQGMVNVLNEQDGLYTLFLRGIENGKIIDQKHLISNIIKCVDPYNDFKSYLNLAHEENLEFVVSNTTEAGIEYINDDRLDASPPKSFPAKLTRLLLERYNYFKGDSKKGLTIIPCELINYNADKLKDCILQYCKAWELDSKFLSWINLYCSFHNTLVDRIVPGYPRHEIELYNSKINYKDNLIVVAESFFLWVIEDNKMLKNRLLFDKTECDVKFVESIQPYRNRKVRILNGIHTSLVPVSYLHGNRTVTESLNDEFTAKFVENLVFDEIINTIKMDKNELILFTKQVLDRFKNPFIIHQLSSIALNSISKFKVRVLPSLLAYNTKFNRLPFNLCFSLASLLFFYKGDWQGESLPIQDNPEVISFFEEQWKLDDTYTSVKVILSNIDLWGEDLSQVKNLVDMIADFIDSFDSSGIMETYKNKLNNYA